VPFPIEALSAASTPIDTADSSRVASPVPIGFTTPTAKSRAHDAAADAAAPPAAGGSPGDAAPPAETREELLARKAREAAEARKKLREEVDNYNAGGDTCISCGS
jgi:hypothetical protein